jgi:hypothetical protein
MVPGTRVVSLSPLSTGSSLERERLPLRTYRLVALYVPWIANMVLKFPYVGYSGVVLWLSWWFGFIFEYHYLLRLLLN